MKKFLIFGSFGLGIILCVHAYWFSMNIKIADPAFDHTVAVALYAAADSISDRVTVERRSSNYYYVTAKTSVSTEEIDTLIREEFNKRQIDQDYEIGIYNAADDSLIQGKYVATPSLIPSRQLHIVKDNIKKNFAVLFPTRGNVFKGGNDFGIQVIILLITSATAWFFIVNLRKFNDEKSSIEIHKKQLGYSVFDYKNQVLYVHDQCFQLTHKESQLLNLFFQNPNQVIPRDEFLEKVWKQDGFFVARSMDVFISRIRKYLKNDPSLKIENLRSIGYRLVTGSNQAKRYYHH